MATERLQRRINLLLDEAEDAIVNSDWELVRDRAQNVLALEPENRDAQALVASAERALGASGATTGQGPGLPRAVSGLSVGAPG